MENGINLWVSHLHHEKSNAHREPRTLEIFGLANVITVLWYSVCVYVCPQSLDLLPVFSMELVKYNGGIKNTSTQAEHFITIKLKTKNYAKVVFRGRNVRAGLTRVQSQWTKDGHKRWTQKKAAECKQSGCVCVCVALYHRRSNAVISNAHTPLITACMCDWGCVLDGTLRECVRLHVDEVVVFTQCISSGWPQAGCTRPW